MKRNQSIYRKGKYKINVCNKKVNEITKIIEKEDEGENRDYKQDNILHNESIRKVNIT